MPKGITFPQRDQAGLLDEIEAEWDKQRQALEDAIIEGGLHIDYARAESRRLIAEARALHFPGGVTEDARISMRSEFMVAGVRAALGLPPKPPVKLPAKGRRNLTSVK